MEMHRSFENIDIAGRLNRTARLAHEKTDAAVAVETAAAPDIEEHTTALKKSSAAKIVFVASNLLFIGVVSWLNVKTLELSLLTVLGIVTLIHIAYALLVHWAVEHGLGRRWSTMSLYLTGCLILAGVFTYIAAVRYDNTGDPIKSALGWILDVVFPILPALVTAKAAHRVEEARFAYDHAQESVRNVLTAAPERQLARYDDVLSRTRDKILKLRRDPNHQKSKVERLEDFADRMMVVHPEDEYRPAAA